MSGDLRYVWDCRVAILELASLATLGLFALAALVVFVRGMVR